MNVLQRWFAAAFVLVLAQPVAAQSERYEVGRRLKAFEAAWEKYDSPEARGRALVGLPKLTTQFFAAQLGEAGRTLDVAGFALATDIVPGAARQWVWSLHAVPERRIVDAGAKEIAVIISPFYPVKGELPKNLELQVWFSNKDVVTIKPDKFPLTMKMPLPALGDSTGLDRKLYFLADGAKALRPAAIGVSQISNLKERLAGLKKAADAWETLETIEQATVRDRAWLLARLAAGEVADTDIPAAALLENAETMLDGKPFFTHAKQGQFWLSVPLGGRKSVECRVYIPRKLDRAKPVPVVVALHGAGVGANTFFEAYGAGQIVRECEQRGWVLIAPESGLGLTAPPVASILEKLGERYPLDAKRVFLVGHSMGAMQAVDLASGGKFAGIAALGGGGKLAKPAAFATLPVFVGVGDKDTLALNGARSLNKSLTAAGAKSLTFKEYEGIEHLLIVREALPDVFEMFDGVAK